MSLPNTLMYQPKKNAINSSMLQQVHIPLSGSTVNPLDTITIPLSTGKFGQYLDPTQVYLSFQVSNPDTTNPFSIDHSAYSFFDRVQAQSSGGILSDLQYFGAWSAMILDGASQSAKSSGFSVCAGAGGTSSSSTNIVRAGTTVAKNGVLNVTIPLIGTIFDSTGGDKMIPVGAMNDASLVFYMASNKNAVQAGTAPTTSWVLKNFRVVATYVQIDENAQRMIDQETGGVYRWSTTLWRGFNYTTPTTSAGDSVIVPFKCSSAKTLFSIWRLTAGNESYASNFQSARQNPFTSLASSNTSSFFVQVGAQCFPPIPIRNASEHFLEYQKAWHAMSVPQAFDTNFAPGEYDMSTGVTNGSFVTGVNLETFTGKSGVSHSGLNVTGGTTMIINSTYETTIGSGTSTVAGPCFITSYLNYDALMECSAGQSIVSY